MPKYKVTKMYVVDAANKEEALAKLQTDQEVLKHLEYVSIKEQPQEGGWASTIKGQLLGSNK